MKDSNLFHLTELIIRILMACIVMGFVFGLDPFDRELDPEQWTHHAFPVKPENFPVPVALGIDIAGCIVPVIIVACLNKVYWKKSTKSCLLDFVLYVWGITLAVLSAIILCEGIKRLYGLPRPCFLSNCTATDNKDLWFTIPWYGKDAPEYPGPEVGCCSDRTTCGAGDNNNADFCDQYFRVFEEFPLVPSIPDCERMVGEYTQAAMDSGDIHLERFDDLEDAKMSFPSEHTATTFTFFLFGALYMSHGFMNVDSIFLNAAWYFITLICMGIPVWVSLSRTQVYKHHLTDVLAGLVIAILVSLISFRIYYPINFIQPPMIQLLEKEPRGRRRLGKGGTIIVNSDREVCLKELGLNEDEI